MDSYLGCRGGVCLKLAAWLTLVIVSRTALAQAVGDLKIGTELYSAVELVGEVTKITPTYIELNSAGNVKYVVSMSQERLTEIAKLFARQTPHKFALIATVRANADLNYLASKQYVTFAADLDAKHATRGDVAELTVSASGEAKPLMVPVEGEGGKNVEGKFVVNGQVVGHRDNALTVKTYTEQGKPLTVSAHLAENAAVKVLLNDISLVRPGDAVQVSGYLYPKNKLAVPNAVLGETIEFTLAKPLAGKPRSALAESKSPAKKPAEDAADSNVAANIPAPPAGPPAREPAEQTPEPKRGIESKLLVRDRFTADRDLKYEYDTALPTK